jgi:hypothetical protein
MKTEERGRKEPRNTEITHIAHGGKATFTFTHEHYTKNTENHSTGSRRKFIASDKKKLSGSALNHALKDDILGS